MERWHWPVACGAAYLLVVLLVLQWQVRRLECDDEDAALTRGLASTVADLLNSNADASRVLRALQRGRFRSLAIAVFDASTHEVYVDSARPQDHEHALPPSVRQRELLQTALRAEEANKAVKGPVSTSLYRPCRGEGGQPQLTTLAVTRAGTESRGYIVVVSSCGSEQA